MQNEDSSTLPEQEEGRGMRFASLKRPNRCQVVLEPTSPSFIKEFHQKLFQIKLLEQMIYFKDSVWSI
jgi:hypothetical protein